MKCRMVQLSKSGDVALEYFLWVHPARGRGRSMTTSSCELEVV